MSWPTLMEFSLIRVLDMEENRQTKILLSESGQDYGITTIARKG